MIHEIVKTNKVRPGLVLLKQEWGYDSRPTLETEWVFEGTENIPHDPNRTGTRPEFGIWTEPRGIRDYGAIKREGYENVIVYRVAKERVGHLIPLGWTMIGFGSAYAYMTRFDRKLECGK